jgi:hypothetical protein
MRRRVLCEPREPYEPIVQDESEEKRSGGEGQTNKENNRGKWDLGLGPPAKLRAGPSASLTRWLSECLDFQVKLGHFFLAR